LELKKRNENVSNGTQNERGKMGKGTVEKFGLKAIADCRNNRDGTETNAEKK
jgi:hypothetical protein